MDAFSAEERRAAIDRINAMEYRQFRDTVLEFLPPEDREPYENASAWDGIRLAMIELLER